MEEILEHPQILGSFELKCLFCPAGKTSLLALGSQTPGKSQGDMLDPPEVQFLPDHSS